MLGMVYHYTYICEITYLWIATIQEPDAMCGRRGKFEIILNASFPSIGRQEDTSAEIMWPKG
jgi:hypothetical protein